MSLPLARSRRYALRTRGGRSRNGRSLQGAIAMIVVGLVSLGVVTGLVVAMSLLVWFGDYAGALPPPDALTAKPPFQTTKIFARDGNTLLYEIIDPEGGRRTLVTLDQVPRTLIAATIATEDAGFFSNPGIEPSAIIRAALQDLSHQQIMSGASTITQQVVRNVVLPPSDRLDLSARRKIKEAIIAYQVSQTYTKEQILQIYLNEINYGNRSYGIEAAAEAYFGKPAANLDLAESALLAGLPAAPSYYDPFERLDEVKDRQGVVLGRMVDEGYITPAQAEAAFNEELRFADRRHSSLAPHFVSYVAGLLGRQLGENDLYYAGNEAITTLDPTLQRLAEQTIQERLIDVKRARANNAALVAIDPRNGHILAMVGSVNYDDAAIAGEVNMALAPRSSAGILSPLTYALAFQNGQTLATRVSATADVAEVSTDSGSVGPTDSVSLEEALARGLDAPATRLMGQVGTEPFLDLGNQIGIDDFEQRVVYGPQLTIAGLRVSPLEVAQSYAMLAANGIARTPVVIEQIIGRQHAVPWPDPAPPRDVVAPGAAYLVTAAIDNPDFRASELRSELEVGQPAAVHLAFSEDHHDAWAAGYVSNLAVVVWVGSTDGSVLRDGEPAARIWGDFVRATLKERPSSGFERPSEIVELSLCANPGCSVKQTELAIRGTEKAVITANAQAIAVPTPASGSSRTPLVNRDGPDNPSAVASVIKPEGGGSITIPSVAGLSPGLARQRLAATGLANAPLIQYKSGADAGSDAGKVAVGQVIGTAPAAGQLVGSGTSVVLIVRRD